MTRIVRIVGCSQDVYSIIGPYAMDAGVIRKRKNMPIITRENYVWHVLMEGKKVKAFVGVESGEYNTKLQSFVVLDANRNELRELLKDVLDHFKRTNKSELTISVLKEFADLFEKQKFEIIRVKTNWVDLVYREYEKV